MNEPETERPAQPTLEELRDHAAKTAAWHRRQPGSSWREYHAREYDALVEKYDRELER